MGAVDDPTVDLDALRDDSMNEGQVRSVAVIVSGLSVVQSPDIFGLTFFLSAGPDMSRRYYPDAVAFLECQSE